MSHTIQLPAYSNERLASLGLDELIELMIADEDRVPRNVIDECAWRGDGMAQHLGGLLLDDEHWKEGLSEGEWWLRLHAVMILGRIASERAGLLLVELMRRMSMEDDKNLQGWCSGYWPALFANKPESVLPALRALAEDRAMDWYIRANACDPVIAAADRKGEDVLDAALEWLAGIAADEQEDWEVRLSAGNTLLDFPRAKYRPLLDDLAARQSGWAINFSAEEVSEAFSGVEQKKQWERFDDPWKLYTPDAIAARQERWAKEDAQERERERKQFDGYEGASHFPQPVVRVEPKVGRNDPCPCGSGRKYKKCCLKTAEVAPPDDLTWHRLLRALEELTPELLKFAEAHFGPGVLSEAWGEFTLWNEEPFTPGTPHMQVFMPWFFHDWRPDPATSMVRPQALDGLTLAEAYLRKKGKQLDPLVARYIGQAGIAPFSFFDVVSCQPGSGFVLRDIFTGARFDVTERSGSQHAKPGDIVFGKVVEIDRLAVVEGCAPLLFPPIEKTSVIELRSLIDADRRPLTAATLKEYGTELLEVYHEISERLLHPRMPAIQNTDGDPLEFRRLVFDIESPRAAFDALKHLCITDGAEDLLTDAVFDSQGNLLQIAFPWQKPGNAKNESWDNTVLGQIKIEGGRLTAEVNSENREREFRALIDQLLPGKASYRTTVIQSVEAMLAQAEKDGPTAQASRDVEDLKSHPEVREKMAEMLREHYRTWPHEKLPALGGLTPLQAVKTRDGREMVEALLVHLERSAHDADMPLDESIIVDLRKTLGLVQKPLF